MSCWGRLKTSNLSCNQSQPGTCAVPAHCPPTAGVKACVTTHSCPTTYSFSPKFIILDLTFSFRASFLKSILENYNHITYPSLAFFQILPCNLQWYFPEWLGWGLRTPLTPYFLRSRIISRQYPICTHLFILLSPQSVSSSSEPQTFQWAAVSKTSSHSSLSYVPQQCHMLQVQAEADDTASEKCSTLCYLIIN